MLWARYVTEGRGDRDSAVEGEIELFSGDWFEGEAYEYSFALPTPNGPFTYKGTDLNINWQLEARADSVEGTSETVTESFVLLPCVERAHSIRSARPMEGHDWVEGKGQRLYPDDEEGRNLRALQMGQSQSSLPRRLVSLVSSSVRSSSSPSSIRVFGAMDWYGTTMSCSGSLRSRSGRGSTNPPRR